MIRGVRGAVQAPANEAASIVDASEELMRAILKNNEIDAESVASVLFTVTADLDAAFPAEVRKRIGWDLVPFLCSQEIPVPGAMQKVIRVLVLFETELSQRQIHHQYLGETGALRPDLKR